MTSRRGFLGGVSSLALASLASPLLATSASRPFDPADVIAKARKLAQAPFEARAQVPQDWLTLTYEDYQTRWFRSRDALWSKADRSYNVDFFLPGLYFPRAVQMHQVADGQAHPIAFDLSL